MDSFHRRRHSVIRKGLIDASRPGGNGAVYEADFARPPAGRFDVRIMREVIRTSRPEQGVDK